jgi:hypothetical protein
LNWDLMAPAKLDIQQRTLNATLHQVSQIWHWQVLDVSITPLARPFPA